MSNEEEDGKIYTFIPCCFGKPLNTRWNEIKNGIELKRSSIMRDLVKEICSAFSENIFVKMYDELGENKLDIFMDDPVSRYVSNSSLYQSHRLLYQSQISGVSPKHGLQCWIEMAPADSVSL